MTLARLIRSELEKRGIRTIRRSAQFLGISGELMRCILNKGAVPRDSTITRIAQALGMNPAPLLLAAHRQKLPKDVALFMLDPASPAGGDWQQKRKWPLSQEQCDYLSVIMLPQEIQLIRKYRQLTTEERLQTIGYINYQFATNRVPPPPAPAEPEPLGMEQEQLEPAAVK